MQISIKEPCHENWNEMTPNQQGAFCSKCVQTVVDFSNKSIDEIKYFFNNSETEKTCGRFKTTQLQLLNFDDFYSKFKGFQFSKRLAIIICFTFSAWLFGTNSMYGQTNQHTEIMKGDVAYIPEPKKDTTKKHMATITGTTTAEIHHIKGKIEPTKQPKAEEHLIMGKIVRPLEPIQKDSLRPQTNCPKPKPKKK